MIKRGDLVTFSTYDDVWIGSYHNETCPEEMLWAEEGDIALVLGVEKTGIDPFIDLLWYGRVVHTLLVYVTPFRVSTRRV